MGLISTRGVYGLSAVYELSILNSEYPVQIKEISERASIPQNYLEQLLVVLKKAGIVKSVRGAHGGYLLGKDASDILVGDVLKALEGDLDFCDVRVKNTVLNAFWGDVTKKFHTALGVSITDLAEYQQLLGQEYTYDI